MIVEGLGGFFTNSLALISDAGHMLSDSISLGIALIAFTLERSKLIQIKLLATKGLKY